MRAWSDSNDVLIRRMAAQGCSARAVAAALGPGVTRNMVIGHAYRMIPRVRFKGSYTVGGGCTPDQARRGWDTRRSRQVGPQ